MITKTQAGGGAAAAVVVGTGTSVGLTINSEKETGGTDNSENGRVDDTQNVVQKKQEAAMPQFTVLSLETDFDNEYSQQTHKNNKITGWLFGGYLVGTYGVGESGKSDFNDNSAWWKWSFERWKTDSDSSGSLSEDFGKSKIELAFSPKNPEVGSTGNLDKALNKVCETVCKKKSKDIGFVSTSNESSSASIRDLLRYCSPLQQKPTTIDDKQEQGSIGAFWSSKYYNLVSVKDRSNDIFWKLRNDDFFRSNSNIWSGISLNNSNNPLFHGLYSNRENNTEKTVKEVCQKIYSWASDNEQTKDTDDASKFCSWSYGIYLSNDN